MATIITNNATLNFTSGSDAHSIISNTASITLEGSLGIRKHALQASYKAGESVTYNIFVTNTGSTEQKTVEIKDDLGTYEISPSTKVTPLDFVAPAKLFINDTYISTITGTVPTEKDSVTFTLPTLAPETTALIQFNAIPNKYAPTELGASTIINTASVKSEEYDTPIEDSYTLTLASYADLQIEKSMTSTTTASETEIVYTFLNAQLRNPGSHRSLPAGHFFS